MAFLAVDPALGVRSGTTCVAVAACCSSFDELGLLVLLIGINAVDLALELNVIGRGPGHGLIKLLCCTFLDNGGWASSADAMERLAGDDNVVVVRDDGRAAHFY